MRLDLMNYLVCPTCGGDLTLKISKKRSDEVIQGTIKCKKCKDQFPILKGIPRFVTDTSGGFLKTKTAFSAKWDIYHKSYHQKNWFNFQRDWFIQRFQWNSLKKFNDFLKTRKYILDAGTGLGNSAKYHSTNKNALVFAIDSSVSIDYAYKKYGNTSNINFIQADLRQLPFRKQFFDYIFSDQVLHHTKNTRTSYRYLTSLLQKGGYISIYVYNKKAPIREFADDYIRERTTKMSEKQCVEFSTDMTNLGKNLSKIKNKIVISRDIPTLQIKAGTYDVQRFIYYHFLKCFWSDDNNLQRSIGVNFDWYFPKFAHRHTPQEVKKWYKDTKIKITSFKEIESGISVTGIKS